MKFALAATAIASVLAGSLIPSTSHASLVFNSAENIGGAGLGTVFTLLTIHDNDGTQSGSVFVNGSNAQAATGDFQVGQTQLRTFGEIGLTSAANMRIVFNAAEPSGNGITLANLVMNVWNPSGSLIFSSGPFTSVVHPSTNTGTGNAGFSYGLDAPQTAAFQAAAFGLNFNSGHRIGLTAETRDSQGGNETFFVANIAPVPEPSTWAMLLAGLGMLGFMARRRAKQA